MSKSQEEWAEQQRRDQYHSGNLQGAGQQQGEAAQVLSALSEIDDIPVDPEEEDVMGQMFSKVASTANLTEEEVRSFEWLHEILLVLYLSSYPKEDGCHGDWRGYAHGDMEEAIEPIDAKTRMKLEAQMITGKKVSTRSREAKVIEEGTRNVSESVLTEDGNNSGSSGILGKLGL